VKQPQATAVGWSLGFGNERNDLSSSSGAWILQHEVRMSRSRGLGRKMSIASIHGTINYVIYFLINFVLHPHIVKTKKE